MFFLFFFFFFFFFFKNYVSLKYIQLSWVTELPYFGNELPALLAIYSFCGCLNYLFVFPVDVGILLWI